MKKLLLFATVLFFVGSSVASATFISGSTGADGAFNPTANTVLQVPADGIYNFTSVNIPAGVTVTFQKNVGNTPIYMLATGDVSINGVISVSGLSATNTQDRGVGGLGGYDGGNGGVVGGGGLGPGGGFGGPNNSSGLIFPGGGGGYGTAGGQKSSSSGAGGPSYGNARIVPLTGGSGGGGNGYHGNCCGGGGGGGALLIASSGNITINGSVLANGGNAYANLSYYYAGGGSGGAIKLMANQMAAGGVINARGGTPWGGAGRIRLEAFTNSIVASDPPYTYGLPGSIFVANSPSLTISSVAGTAIPSNPTGSYAQPDLMLPSTTTNPVTVAISASNIPVGTQVTVSVVPQYGTGSSGTGILSGVDASVTTASANVTLSSSYSNVIMATVTYTLQASLYWNGEKIKTATVSTNPGKNSEVVYITDSGKEIKEEQLVLAGLIRK
jgi:hypothetical protein